MYDSREKLVRASARPSAPSFRPSVRPSVLSIVGSSVRRFVGSVGSVGSVDSVDFRFVGFRFVGFRFVGFRFVGSSVRRFASFGYPYPISLCSAGSSRRGRA